MLGLFLNCAPITAFASFLVAALCACSSSLAFRQAAQCVGQVIRSKADYGMMIFADKRIYLTLMSTGHKPYEGGLQHTSCAESKGKIYSGFGFQQERGVFVAPQRRYGDMVHIEDRSVARVSFICMNQTMAANKESNECENNILIAYR